MKSISRLFILLTVIALIVGQAAAQVVSPTVTTDYEDYEPGSTAYMTGSSFQANEAVSVQILRINDADNDGLEHQPWEVTADIEGNFQTSWFVPAHETGATLLLTATG